MRTVAYLVACTIVAASLAGCRQSTRSEAGSQLGEKVELARRHYTRAMELLGTPRAHADGDVASNPAENPEALKALQTAQGILREAIGASAQAAPTAQVDAQSLLSDVSYALGSYRSQLFRWSSLAIEQQLAAAEAQVLAASLSAGEAAGQQARASGGTSGTSAPAGGATTSADAVGSATAVKDQAVRDERAAQAKIDQLTAKIQELTTKSQSYLDRAIQLRNQVSAATGQTKLDLYKELAGIERESGLVGGEIGQRKAELDAAQSDLALAKQRRQAAEEQLATITRLAGQIQTAASQAAQSGRQATNAVTAMRDELTKQVAAIRQQAVGAMACADEAVEAYEDASRAALAALSAAGTAAGEASEIRQQQGERPSSPVVALASSTRQSAAQAQRGHAVLAKADQQRQRLELARRLSEFAAATKKAFETMRAPAPEGLDALAALVPNAQDITKSAEEDYDLADEAYKSAANQLPSDDSVEPVINTRATAWLYQAQGVHALLGRYWLTGAASDRTKAEAAIGAFRTQHSENPYAQPVLRDLESLLGPSPTTQR